MEAITTLEKYNEKVEAFRAINEDESVSLEEKIRLCEEFAYCDYVKGSGRIDFVQELGAMYLKAGRYQNAVDFILTELKTHFDNDKDWWMFIAPMLPQCSLYVVDAYIALKDYKMAKGFLDALKINRESMLNMHQNDGLTEECQYWYARVMAKYGQIAYLEGDIASAIHYLVDPIFDDCKPVEAIYYTGLTCIGDKDPECKDIPTAINCFTYVSDLDTDHYNPEIDMIVSSNYYLGLIYATENGYKNKEKAISHLTKAKEIGYSITDEEIKQLTENVVDSLVSQQTGNNNNSSEGCYVATCVYGSYDCPEVWTLRRFRDNTLSKNIFGRLFIKLYYSISPSIVKLFGHYSWFHRIFKSPLDALVKNLIDNGVENTPYND